MFVEQSPQPCPQIAENLTTPLPEEGAVEGTMLGHRKGHGPGLVDYEYLQIAIEEL